MSLTTRSQFWFGHIVTASNNKIDFDEGGPELTATLTIGEYSLTDFVTEVKTQLDSAGGQVYTVSLNRATRILTISAAGNFSLLTTSGTNVALTAYTLMGYSGADKTGTNTYTAGAETGSQFRPQFILQNHVSTDDSQSFRDASVNVSANGTVEVVSFGTEKFLTFQIQFQTDIGQPANHIIENDVSGVANVRAFMQNITQRVPIEFMADRDTPTTFQKVQFESSADSRTGTGYRLKELFNRGLPGYFETAILRFRLIE